MSYDARLDERLRFLFGDAVFGVIDDYDLDDEADRRELVEDFAGLPVGDDARESRMAVRTVAATQILGDDPPETWQTAKRLQDLGLDRDAILSQLSMVIAEQLAASLSNRTTFDVAAFVEALGSLPLPTGVDVARCLIDAARAQPGIAASDHDAAVLASFGEDPGGVIAAMVDRTLEGLVDGPLAWLAEDRTFVVADLVEGATFTHRLIEFETSLGALTASTDFGALNRFDHVGLVDGTGLEVFSVDRGHLGWGGPDGWLDSFAVGDVLACTITTDPVTTDPVSPRPTSSGLGSTVPAGAGDGVVDPFGPMSVTVRIERVDEPVLDGDLVAAVRVAYDRLGSEAGLPIAASEIAWEVLSHQPAAFASPQVPLSELCEAAGLDVRGGWVGHDASVWRAGLLHRRVDRGFPMVAEQRWRALLGRALEVLDDPDAEPTAVRAVLDSAAEPEVLDALVEVLFPEPLEPADEFAFGYAEAPGRLFELVHRATAVAKRPREVATAGYLAAVLYERCGDPERAAQHLNAAGDAQPRLGPVVERLGWYAFDRGDAKEAMKWWRTFTERPQAADELEPFLAPAASGVKLGRNDACWCGSGRKFKRCHQGETELPALPDRVGWLCRKAVLWMEHNTDDVRQFPVDLAIVRVTGDATSGWEDLDDAGVGRVAQVFDDPIVFDTALHEGGLFERFLAERGPLLPADEQLLAASWLTVERSVHEVISVDPGAGMVLRDLATGEDAEVTERTLSTQASVGQRFCTRVVPDGASHQIIGGVFEVRTGQETAVLDICAERDPFAVCAWVGAAEQPPQLVHAPGMADGMFDTDALQAVLEQFDDATTSDSSGLAGSAEAMAALQEEISRQAMQHWLDDHVPALGGLTPHQAAQDPTRRDQLERLLTEFERTDTAAEGLDGEFTPITYDVAHLRNELGLT